MSLREQLEQLSDVVFPEVVEAQTRLLKSVALLVATEGSDSETMTRFTVGRDAHGRNWIYAYLDEPALRRGTIPGQQYSVFRFDDLVEIAKSNGFGGIIIDQHEGQSSAILPEDYFDLTLAYLQET